MALAAQAEPAISAQQWVGNAFNNVKATIQRTFNQGANTAEKAKKDASNTRGCPRRAQGHRPADHCRQGD